MIAARKVLFHYIQNTDIWTRKQCDQIGRFLKVLGDKISNNSSPNEWKHFGQLKKLTLM